MIANQHLNVLDPSGQPDHIKNDIIISVVFKLNGPNDSRFDKTKWQILKYFASEVICNEFGVQQRKQCSNVYRKLPLKYWEQNNGMLVPFKKLVQMFEEDDNYNEDWFENMPQNEQIYQGFEIGQSVGCEHYITGCELKCETCGEFYGCRRCHDDIVSEHQFPREKTQTIRCLFCQKEQPLSLKCEQCQRVLGCQTCSICKYVQYFTDDAKLVYHCNSCKACNIGTWEFSIHCDTCGTCMSKKFHKTHQCQSVGDCCICLGDLRDTKYVWFRLGCGHQIHESCYDSLLDQSQYKCPVCRKFLPIGEDIGIIGRHLQQINKLTVIYPEQTHTAVKVECWDCGNVFPQLEHPFGIYYCNKCKLFNCSIKDRYIDLQDYMAYLVIENPIERQNLPTPEYFKNHFINNIHDIQENQVISEVEQVLGYSIDYQNVDQLAILINQFPFHSFEEFKTQYKKLIQFQANQQNEDE
ncbi:RING_finger and CHY zinc finger domain-containing protein [Hexamita inflata]|uniref:RING finger and CHY zinc finger domain-containing protein n=1 Tax=Hexamita inflata TaxID=28002 RepID=A0AA86NK98_9EUKA|nr:RING finger and CHY zinc finger domain-containing protein [Hexamita inflata]